MPELRRKRAHRARLLFHHRPLARLRERLPRYLSGKNPLFARAGGSSVGGALPAGRATRGIAALVFLALLLIAGRFYIGQRFDVPAEIERTVRRDVIPALEKQWKVKIEVGAIQSDWLSRVILDEVVVGRDKNLPTGALARARKIVLNVDIVALGLRRVAVADAISGASVEEPQIYLARDRKGVWNFARFLNGQNRAALSHGWTGRVGVSGGRVFLRDEMVRGASGVLLVADAREIAGFADFAPHFPVHFQASAQKTILPLKNAEIGVIASRGAATLDGKSVGVSLQLPPSPALIVADYAFPKREVVAQSGTLSGNVQLAFDGQNLVPRGQIEVKNVTGFAQSVALPGQKTPLKLQNVSGPLSFAGQAFSTQKLEFSALGTPWKMAGAVSAQKTPLFDVQLATTRANMPFLVALAPKNALPGQFSSAPSRLSARLSGTPKNLTISGLADVPTARFTAPQGQFAAPLVHTSFAAKIGSQTALALRLNAPNAHFGAKNWGEGRAQTLLATVQYVQNGPISGEFTLQNWRAAAGRYGVFSAPVLRGRAATPSLARPDWRGALSFEGAQTGGVQFTALAPQVAPQIAQQLAQIVRPDGLLSGQAEFSGVGSRGLKSPGAVVRLNVGLSSLRLQSGELGLIRLANLRGAAQFSGGTWRGFSGGAQSENGSIAGRADPHGQVFIAAPNFSLAPSQLKALLAPQGLDLDAGLRGRLSLIGTPGGVFQARFDLGAPQATLRNQNGAFLGRLQGARLRGGAKLRVGTPQLLEAGGAVLEAQNATLGSGILGKTGLTLPVAARGARLVGLKIEVQNALNPAGRISAIRAALPLQFEGKTQVLTLQNPDALFQKSAGGLELPRLSANWAGGQLTGFARVGKGIQGAILGQNLAALTLQRFAAPDSLKSARLSGPLNARLDLAPNGSGNLRAVLEQGSVAMGGKTVPLANARVDVGFQSGNFSRFTLREASVWSQGGRLAASGDVFLGKKVGFNGTLKIQNARLATLAQLPGVNLDSAFKGGAADGLLSGEFKANGGAEPKLDGRANVRLAHFAGVDLEASVGDVTATMRARGLDFRLANLVGRAEGAPFDGEIEWSQESDFWRVQLHTTGVAAARLTRLGPKESKNAPLRGELAGDVDLSGSLVNGIKPENGFVNLQTGPLTWRGRQVGALRADVAVTDGIVRAKRFDLLRVGVAEDAPEAALLSFHGRMPLTADERELDAQFRLNQAPLSHFLDVVNETRRLMRADGTPQPVVEKIGALTDALPMGVSGQVALDADLSGSWKAPKIEVKNLTLRAGRARIPQGGFSPPATLDAAFTFENNAFTVEKGDFRLKRAYKDEDGEDDDTLVRVTKGGKIALDGPLDLGADVLNANLSELAIWIPALRGQDGKPLLHGKLPIFSISVAGTSADPQVTGSVEAEDLAFTTNTLDALRISRFQIAGGQLRIEPGKLTVAKGKFQSSAAWGQIPWSWNPPGPQFNAPLEVHLPVQKADFGALSSVFLPSLTAASADEFSGSLDVVGTLNAPAISGALKIRGGKFRLDPKQTALEAGVENLSGGVRFLNGNQLVIDADDPLKGRLVTATQVKAKGKGKTDESAPQLAGEFSLGGNVAFDFDPKNALDPRGALARHRYDLRFSLDKGAYSSSQFSGARNVAAGLLFQTGPGEARTHQNVKWMLAAQGQGQKSSKGGAISSVGAIALNPNFARDFDAIFRSRGENFSSWADFASFPVAARVSANNFPDRRSQIVFNAFAAQVPQVGRGLVDGRLVLDNGARQQEAPAQAAKIQTASFERKLATRKLAARRRSLFGPSFDARDDFERDFGRPGDERIVPLADQPAGAAPPDTTLPDTALPDDENAPVLRLGGQLTVSEAEFYGAPAESDGLAGKLSFLPAAPRLDAKLLLGKNVQIVTPTLRAALGGEVTLGGTPQNPEIFGVLAAREGQVRFPNARARLEEGQITVAATRDPATDTLRTRVEVEATARGQVGRYAIMVRVSGPLDLSDQGTQNFRVEVTSNPPLSQDEAFAQLLGTSVRDFTNSSGGLNSGNANEAYARAVLQLVTAPLFSGVENSLAQALGLTSVGFEYRFNEPLGVQLTKSLGDRVFVTYRRSLGRSSGGLTPYQLRIDYRIKGDLLLGLQTDERATRELTLQKTFRF